MKVAGSGAARLAEAEAGGGMGRIGIVSSLKCKQ